MMTKIQTDTWAELAIVLPLETIQAFCQRWQIAEDQP